MPEGGVELNALESAPDPLQSLRGEVAEFPDVFGAEICQLGFFQ